MSSFPKQLISTDSDQHGNCCCTYCPFFNQQGCENCPGRLIQLPSFSYECTGPGPDACGGVVSPPLIQTDLFEQGSECFWMTSGQNVQWCPNPVDYINRIEITGGCGLPLTGAPTQRLIKWYVHSKIFACHENDLCLFGAQDIFESWFVKLDAPPSGEPGTPGLQCLPTGIYEHAATRIVDFGSPTTGCHPALLTPMGDVQVIAL